MIETAAEMFLMEFARTARCSNVTDDCCDCPIETFCRMYEESSELPYDKSKGFCANAYDAFETLVYDVAQRGDKAISKAANL